MWIQLKNWQVFCFKFPLHFGMKRDWGHLISRSLFVPLHQYRMINDLRGAAAGMSDSSELKYSEKTWPGATLSTTIPIWHGLGSNLDRRDGKLVTNRLSYSTALRELMKVNLGTKCCMLCIKDREFVFSSNLVADPCIKLLPEFIFSTRWELISPYQENIFFHKVAYSGYDEQEGCSGM
jgi:hypothetical protein